MAALAATACYQSVWVGDGTSTSTGEAAGDGLDFPDSEQPGLDSEPQGGREVDTAPEGFGEETLCNDLDDDGNGIIDDVDQNGDGVCDCLRIATLGTPGAHGDNDVFTTWLDERSQIAVSHLVDEPLTAALIAPYHIIVFQDLSGLSPLDREPQAEVLDAWIAEGGGLMTLNGYHADAGEIDNVNALLSPLLIQYGPEDIMGDNDSTSTPVTEWADHPISDGVSAVGMKFGRPVLGDGLTLATGQGPLDNRSYSLGKVKEHGDGKVLVWADEWITYESEWVSRTDYQVERFWLNTLVWLAPPGVCKVPVTPDTDH